MWDPQWSVSHSRHISLIHFQEVWIYFAVQVLEMWVNVLGFVKDKDIPLGRFKWLTVRSHDVRFTMEPTAMGPNLLAVLDDTCGNLFPLIQVPATQ